MPSTARPLTFAQLEALWISNGGSRALAPTMAAIALAESSGNPASVNAKDNNGKQTSWGLWQISDGTHNMPAANILDPNVNAQQAVKKYKSQGLSAWGTYTSGKYRQFMSNASPNASGLPSGSTNTATDAIDPLDPLGLSDAIGGGFASAFSALLQPIVEISLWGGEIIFGMLMMTGGVILFALNTNAGKKATAETKSLAETAIGAAAPEIIPEMAALSRIRSKKGRKSIVAQKAKEAAQNSPRGKQIAAQQREKRIQREQKTQADRRAVRQEAARRNRGNSGSGNS